MTVKSCVYPVRICHFPGLSLGLCMVMFVSRTCWREFCSVWVLFPSTLWPKKKLSYRFGRWKLRTWLLALFIVLPLVLWILIRFLLLDSQYWHTYLFLRFLLREWFCFPLQFLALFPTRYPIMNSSRQLAITWFFFSPWHTLLNHASVT